MITLIINNATRGQAEQLRTYAARLGLPCRIETGAAPPEDRAAGRPAVYPWGELDVGKTAEIEIDRERLKSARTAALRLASRKGWRFRTAYRDGRLYVTRES